MLYAERSESWRRTAEADGESPLRGLGAALGLTNDTWASMPAEATFEIFDAIEDLHGKVPEPFHQAVLVAANAPVIEDLDI